MLVLLVYLLDNILVVLSYLLGHGLQFHFQLVVLMISHILLLLEGQYGILQELNLFVLELDVPALDLQLVGLFLEEGYRLLFQLG